MRRRRNRFPRVALLAIALLLAMCIMGVGYAAWTDDAYIEQTMTSGTWDVGGSMGFWMTWWTHYSEAEVEEWLGAINGASNWLGPTTLQGLSKLSPSQMGGCAGMQDRFLAHYMATRLSIAAGRLNPANTHDITGIEGYGYLDLLNPAAATLSDIVVAIEAKYPYDPEDDEAVWPTTQQYEVMKDICEAINSLQT